MHEAKTREQMGIVNEAVNIYKSALQRNPEDTNAYIKATDHIENYYNGDIFGEECQTALKLFNWTMEGKI
jgi:hypothetical protein